MPERIQRKRSKGFKLPPNTVVVTRGTKWGNPFVVNPKVTPGGYTGGTYIAVPTVNDAIGCYLEFLNGNPDMKSQIVPELRGKNLACFCKIGDPCHADILLEIANGLPQMAKVRE